MTGPGTCKLTHQPGHLMYTGPIGGISLDLCDAPSGSIKTERLSAAVVRLKIHSQLFPLNEKLLYIFFLFELHYSFGETTYKS
jgi:hypothetical protein